MAKHQLENRLLFPYDFSEISDHAVDHLGNIARLLDYEVEVLNILDPGTRAFMRENKLSRKNLEEKIVTLAAEIGSKYNLNTTSLVKNVTIKKISKVSYREKASMIMLGIDAPRRKASRIMKVVLKSAMPVFIVQQQIPYQPFKNILFPLDDSLTSRQKSGWALRFARATGATIRIFSVNPAILDNKEKEYRQYKIIEQLERFFKKNGAAYTTTVATGKYKEFAPETLAFADDIGCDLYIIMSKPPSAFSIVDPVDYDLIFNKSKMPVLCVHSKDLFVGGGFN